MYSKAIKEWKGTYCWLSLSVNSGISKSVSGHHASIQHLSSQCVVFASITNPRNDSVRRVLIRRIPITLESQRTLEYQLREFQRASTLFTAELLLPTKQREKMSSSNQQEYQHQPVIDIYNNTLNTLRDSVTLQCNFQI